MVVWVIIDMVINKFCMGMRRWYKNLLNGYLINILMMCKGVVKDVIVKLLIVILIISRL